MKSALLALLVVSAACGDNAPYSYPVDAGNDARADAGRLDAAIDAHIDAAQPPPQQRGCSNMGNLPDAMTAVLTDDDPIPSALLVELQEQHVGDKHSPRAWVIPAGAFCLTGGTGTLNNGIWTMTGNQNTKLEAPFPIPWGTTIDAIELFYIRQSISLSSYTLTLKETKLRQGQPVTVTTPVTVAQNNGVQYPNIDTLAANAGSGHGLTYTVPSFLTPPFDVYSYRWQLDVFQNAAPFDAQLLGMVVFTHRH